MWLVLSWPLHVLCSMPQLRSPFPRRGSNSCPLQWNYRVLATEPRGNSSNVLFRCILLFSLWPHLMACAILVPQPGIKPTPSCTGSRVLTTGPPGKSLFLVFFNHKHNYSYNFNYSL